MDLTARVTALEEEVSVLKGEIKMILTEVRTAVLARDNPFASTVFDLTAPPATPPLAAVPPPPVAASPPVVAAIKEPSNGHVALASMPEPIRQQQSKDGTPAVVEAERAHRWSVHSLAALMSWTQESVQTFSKDDLGIVLSLACYGGLIDSELEMTLARLAEVLAPEEKPRKATSNDFLLGLRQLDALLDEAKETNYTDYPARRAS